MSLRMQMLFIFTVLWSSGLGFTCLDYNNNPVDWYSVYKIPKISGSSDWKLRDGFAHFYLDVNQQQWQFSDYAMNQTQQAVYETLNPVYESQVLQEGDYMYLMYNDQPPEKSGSDGGHTKGVVAFDKTSGFWLIHSVPHFPPAKNDGYSWPRNALDNGQTFLCVSFRYEELGNISTQLQFNQPHIYDSHVPPSFCQDFPSLCSVLKGAKSSGPSSVLQLTSLGGQEFTSFAKSSDFGLDLYVALVAPYLQQDLLVETWQDGTGGKLSSDCSAQYKVMNIKEVTFPNAVFKSTKDHSKWVVSFSNTFGKKQVLKFSSMAKWTCIGDINRMESQFERGGGTLCLQNPAVWEAFRNTVTKYENCTG